MPNLTKSNVAKLILFISVLIAVSLSGLLYKEQLTGMFIQTTQQPEPSIPLVQIIPDLPHAPAPVPVQNKVLPPTQALVIEQVQEIKAVQQRLTLAKLEGELDELAYQQKARALELKHQQWSLEQARLEAMSKSKNKSLLTHLNDAKKKEESAPTAQSKPLVSTPLVPPKKKPIVKKPTPKLLGILSDKSAVLWFNGQQHILALKQSTGPVTLVTARHQDGEVDILFYGQSLTLTLQTTFKRERVIS